MSGTVIVTDTEIQVISAGVPGPTGPAGSDATVTKAAVDALGVNADTVDSQHAAAFATAAQGSLADSAVQPGDLGTVTLEVETTSAYTPALADVGKLKQINNSSATTITLPPNSSVAFSIGDTIAWVRGVADFAVTFSAGAGVTIQSAGSLLSMANKWSTATTIYLGSDVWLLSGDLS